MTDERRGRPTPSQARDTGEMSRTGVVARVVDGRYRLLERLDEGPIGSVYRVEDVLLERIMVKKTLAAAGDLLAPSLERFTKEARALARVRHGNVAQIHGYGAHDGAPFIAMEYVAGESLAVLIEAHALRGEKVELEDALAIARGVAAGLGALHARGIVHGNIEPRSILIDGETGRPVLIDFRLADLGRTSDPKLGRPSPVAPEQVLDPSQPLTERADVYAFACTLFELFTGRAVFTGEAQEVSRAHGTAPPPRVSSLAPRLRSFDSTLLRAMSKAPADRHASCEEVVAELDAAVTFLRGIEPVRAIVQTATESVRRRLVRFVGDALSVLRRPILIDCVSTYDGVVTALARRPAQIVVLDTLARSAESHSAVLGIRTMSPDAHVVVLAADWDVDDELLADLGARRLPKPIVAHLARGLFGAAAVMIATPKSS